MRRSVLFAGALTGVVAAITAAYWIVRWRAPDAKAPPAIFVPRPAPQVVAPLRASTIIDLPGDPVLVQRGAFVAPKETRLALPLRLASNDPPVENSALYVAGALVSTAGGYMGKFPDSGRDADDLAAQLAANADAMSAFNTDAAQAADDDGGEATPSDAAIGILPQNSNVMEVAQPARPATTEASIKIAIPGRLADVLVANGFSEDSARAAEGATKSLFNLQKLPAGAAALARGVLDSSGAYRLASLALYEQREYVGSIALGESGAYIEGARPIPPEGLLDEAPASGGAMHFTLADGVYSAGLRNGMPEVSVREAVQLLGRLVDLHAGLTADESFRALYTRETRGKLKGAGTIIYIGVSGSSGAAECYAVEAASGAVRCFDPKGGGAPGGGSAASLGQSGAIGVGGILAPIKGAAVTSLYGMRFHPILHILRLHAGIDFGAPVGSPVRASADGTVEIAGPAQGFGNHIRIQHQGFETSYSHLSDIAAAIHPGSAVKQGDVIALSGNTGLSTGPHLHFEYYENGVAVDPLPHMGAEVQATAPVAGSGLASPGASNTRFSEAEIAAFPAYKSQIDAALRAVAP